MDIDWGVYLFTRLDIIHKVLGLGVIWALIVWSMNPKKTRYTVLFWFLLTLFVLIPTKKEAADCWLTTKLIHVYDQKTTADSTESVQPLSSREGI